MQLTIVIFLSIYIVPYTRISSYETEVRLKSVITFPMNWKQRKHIAASCS